MGHTVLITGANGLLGRVLRETLSKYNFSVIATGLGVDRMTEVADLYEEMDVTVAANCEKILNKYQPDFIVNAAALTDVDACEQDHDLCLSVNTHSILHFIPFLKKHDAHLIHVSTDFVFDGTGGPYKETDFCNPINYYGVSKIYFTAKAIC